MRPHGPWGAATLGWRARPGRLAEAARRHGRHAPNAARRSGAQAESRDCGGVGCVQQMARARGSNGRLDGAGQDGASRRDRLFGCLHRAAVAPSRRRAVAFAVVFIVDSAVRRDAGLIEPDAATTIAVAARGFAAAPPLPVTAARRATCRRSRRRYAAPASRHRRTDTADAPCTSTDACRPRRR